MHRNIIGGSLSLGTSRSISNTIQPTETASIAYDGTLLPTGTASYGSELVVNGDFSNGLTSWLILNTDTTHTVTAEAGGVRFIADTTTVLTTIKQNIGTTNIAKTYLLSITISDYVSGSLKFDINGSTVVLPTTVGTYTYMYNPTSNGDLTFYRNSSNVNMRLDDISVKEVLINPNLRYLKNSGKDKTPALVESGQGKFFNGTSQYIAETWANIGYTGVKTAFTLSFNVSNILNSNYLFNSGYESSNQGWSVKLNGTASIQFFTNLGTDAGMVMSLGGITNPTVTYTFNNGLVRGYVNGVFKIEKQFGITNVNFVSAEKFCIGAYRASSSYASATVSSVSFYTDTVLSDSQIQSLYLYPERVKAYNGAIVPDIGSEANCKLFMPLCENSGSNVVNVAVARGVEILSNGGFDTDTLWVQGVGVTISASVLNFNTASNNIQAYQQTLGGAYGALKINTKYKVTYTVSAYTSGNVNIVVGGTISTANKSAVGTYEEIITTGASVVNFIYITSTFAGTGFVGSIDNVSVKEITAYPLTNYTTAMHTSAAKLSYGAQCTAWKRDSLGVLLGMSNGLSFDGGVSVKYPVVAIANAIPDTTPIVMEAIVYCEVTSDYKFIMGSNLLRVGIDLNGEPWCRVGSFQTSITPTTSTTIKNAYHHVVVQSNGTVVNAWVDGIQYKTNTAFTSGGVDGANFVLGSSGWDKPYKRIAGTPKIYKGAQYAKFDIAKAWAKAQKTIAKLGA